MGLAIAKSVAERYGGTIGVESQVGKYTVLHGDASQTQPKGLVAHPTTGSLVTFFDPPITPQAEKRR